MGLVPDYPYWYPVFLGIGLIMLGRFEEALVTLQEASKSRTEYGAVHLFLAAALAGLGREQEARVEAQRLLRDTPRFSIQEWAARQSYKNPAELEKITNLLRNAGLPD